MNILTFDIEEWFVYEQYPKGGPAYYLPILNDCLIRLLDFLDERNTKATFFCLGVLATSHPLIVRQIAARGHEIGCHSNKHILLNQMTPQSFGQDTFQAIDRLQNLLGKRVDKYRAPAFSVNESTKWALEILVENGVKYDCSIFPRKYQPGEGVLLEENYPYAIRTASGIIYEFPLSFSELWTMRLFYSGGGYFRLFPYKWIKALTGKNAYNMTYFHIRDFDSQQKRVYTYRYFHSYYGVNGAFQKFCQYVSDFEFVPLGVAAQLIDWESKILTA